MPRSRSTKRRSLLPALRAADISGKVTLKGTPPAEKEITPLKNDPNCGKAASGPVLTRHYVVGADAGLANVFVYIKAGLEGKTFPAPEAKAEIDQVACLYQPYVVGLQVGQTLSVKNSDPFLHNVNASSTVGNAVFNFAQGAGAKAAEKTFTKPEAFLKLQCNVHPWMFGYLGISESPYFAVTDKDGKFKLPAGLPAGKYTLAFKHLKAGEVTQEITVADGDKKEVSAALEVPAAK